MTNEQSKAHWWIVNNHPDFEIEPPKKYFEVCDIVFNALQQGQKLPIDSVTNRTFQCNRCGTIYTSIDGDTVGCCVMPVEHRTSGVCGGELIEVI